MKTPRRGTRPTPVRLRAALFDALAFEPRGRFLDLYAGSGSVGLEAASRGWEALLVERSASAVKLLRENARACGLAVRVIEGDALSAAAELAGNVDVVFVDPPFELDLAAVFGRLLDLGVARAGGRYAFQHPSRLDLARALGDRPVEVDTRRYGGNSLSFVRR